MLDDLKYLSGVLPTDEGLIESRFIEHAHHERASRWLQKQFNSIEGVEVELHEFTVMGRSLNNIIAKRRGRRNRLAPIIVAAHYDSIASFEPEGTWYGPIDPAPGADDDGSGVVAVLELARLFSTPAYATERPVWFILFTAEEHGLLGSTAYVNELVQSKQDVNIMLSLDPIGFNPANAFYLWYSFKNKWSQSATLLDTLASQRGGPLIVQGVEESLFGGDDRSDHFPFWQNDFPALHLANFPLSPNYHTMNDQFEDIDPLYLTHTTRLVADFIQASDALDEHSGTCATGESYPSFVYLWICCGLAISRRSRNRSKGMHTLAV